MRCLLAIFLVAIFMVTIPGNIYAYIDPGAGSLSLQVVIAFLVTGLFCAKLWFKKIKEFLLKVFFRKNKSK